MNRKQHSVICKIGLVWLLIGALLAMPSVVRGWTNPMGLPGLENRSLGDPYIMKYRGYFYLYVSADNQNIYCWRTKDLVEWSQPYVCCTDPTTAVAYAPEVVYWNGVFYMCTSPRGGGHYLLSSESPTGPFVHRTDNLGREIDGSMFTDDDGKRYFYRADFGGIRGCLMPTPLTLDKDVDLHCCISGQWTEGPCVFKRNGLYYLLYTGNHVLTDGYRIDYAISGEGPLSGFTPQSEQNPILVDTETPKHKALGHGTAFVGPDLDTYYFCYHNLLERHSRRLLNFERIAWNGDRLMMTGPTDWEQDPPLVATTDYFERDEVGQQWTFPKGGKWSIADGDRLCQSNARGLRTAVFQSCSYNDYTAEFTLRAAQGAAGRCGAIFSYADKQNYSVAVINVAERELEISVHVKGKERLHERYDLPRDFDPEKWHSMRVEKRGIRVKVFIDGMCKAQFTTAVLGGKVGYVTRDCAADFGYIAVSPYVEGSAVRSVSLPVPGMLAANLWKEATGEVSSTTEDMSAGKYNLMRCSAGVSMTYSVNVQRDGHYNIGLRYRSDRQSRVQLLLDGKPVTTAIELASTQSAIIVKTINNVELQGGRHRLTMQVTDGKLDIMEYNIKRGVENPHQMADDFDKDLNPEWGYREGKWNTVDGQLESTGRYGKMLMGDFDNIHLTDYTVECDIIYPAGDTNGGLLFRTTNASTGGADDSPVLGTDFLQGYFFLADDTTVTLGKHNFGWQVLKTVSHATDITKPHHMKVEVEGANIRCYLDDMQTPLIRYTDPVPFITGRAGIRVHNSVVRFDNFVVKMKGASLPKK